MTVVQSVERAFSVIGCLASGPAGVSEISERVTLPKSTVSRLLVTLVELGVVEQSSPGGAYRLGNYMHELANAAQPTKRLIDLARPHLVELVAATHEASGLSVRENELVLYLDQVNALGDVQVRDWTGERLAPHLVSSGLVLLAFSGRDAIERYLDKPLASHTPNSMTNPTKLRERLARVRGDGFDWVIDEFQVGVSSVAAPVKDARGNVIAAIHLHGPTFRFPGSSGRQFEARVVAAADRLSRQLT